MTEEEYHHIVHAITTFKSSVISHITMYLKYFPQYVCQYVKNYFEPNKKKKRMIAY